MPFRSRIKHFKVLKTHQGVIFTFKKKFCLVPDPSINLFLAETLARHAFIHWYLNEAPLFPGISRILKGRDAFF
jgi:hypothetical protein